MLFAPDLAAAPQLHRQTVESGLRVVVAHRPKMRTSVVAMTYLAGAAHEKRGEEGLAALTRALAERGDGDSGKLASARARLIAEGAVMTVQETAETTTFVTALENRHLALALWQEAIRMAVIDVTPQALDAAKRARAVRRRDRVRFDLAWQTQAALLGVAFGNAAPLASDAALQPQDVRRFHAQRFAPERAALVVIGPTAPEEVLRLVAESVGKVRRPAATPAARAIVPQRSQRYASVRSDGVHQSAVAHGFRIPERGHADHPALTVAAEMLAGGRNSVLHNVLVQKKGWAFAVNARTHEGATAGMLVVYAEGPRTTQPSALASVIEREAQLLANATEVDAAKQRAITRLRRSQSSPAQRARSLGRAVVLTGDARTARKRAREIAKVTRADIARVVQRYLVAENSTVVEGFPAPILLNDADLAARRAKAEREEEERKKKKRKAKKPRNKSAGAKKKQRSKSAGAKKKQRNKSAKKPRSNKRTKAKRRKRNSRDAVFVAAHRRVGSRLPKRVGGDARSRAEASNATTSVGPGIPRPSEVPPRAEAPPPVPTSDKPPPPELPTVSKRRTPAGITYAVVDVPEASRYAVSLVVDAGALDDRPGVASLSIDALTNGRGRGLTTRVTGHRIVLETDVGADNLDGALTVLADAVGPPGLPRASFQRVRSSAIMRAESWSRDRPGEVLVELIGRVLLGGGDTTSRRAKLATRSELSRIRHQHIDAFYRSQLHAKRSWLLIAGPAVPADLEGRIDARWSAYVARSKREPPALKPRQASLLAARPGARHRVLFIEDPRSTEPEVHAFRWLPRLTPTTADAMFVLGEAHEGVALERLGPGAVLHTRLRASNDTVVTDARAAVNELDALGLTEAQTRAAQRRLVTRHALLMQDPVALSRWLLDATETQPDAYFEGLGGRLASVNAKQVAQTLEELAEPAWVVVFGDGDLLAEPLRALGDVRIVDPRRGFAVRRALPAR